MGIMFASLHMAKQGPESHSRWKVDRRVFATDSGVKC